MDKRKIIANTRKKFGPSEYSYGMGQGFNLTKVVYIPGAMSVLLMAD